MYKHLYLINVCPVIISFYFMSEIILYLKLQAYFPGSPSMGSSIEYRQSAKRFSSRWNWDSPTPLAAGECAPPTLWSGGEGTLAWGSPNSNEGTYTVVLYIYKNFVGSSVPRLSLWHPLPPTTQNPFPFYSLPLHRVKKDTHENERCEESKEKHFKDQDIIYKNHSFNLSLNIFRLDKHIIRD